MMIRARRLAEILSSLASATSASFAAGARRVDTTLSIFFGIPQSVYLTLFAVNPLRPGPRLCVYSSDVRDWADDIAEATLPDEPEPYLDPEVVRSFGRFVAAANPWIKLGANCLPQVPGEKKPAVGGWGKSGARWHSEDSEKIDLEHYKRWALQFREHNALVFPATIGAMVVDVDSPAILGKVLEACGDTPYRTFSGRVGGGVHLWYAGVCGSRNGVVPHVDVKSTGGYVICPGSLHASTGNEYRASDELAEALRSGTLVLPNPHQDWRERIVKIASGIREPSRLDLFALADQLYASTRTRTIGKALREVGRGEPFAGEGERDGTLFTLLAKLAEFWPNATEDAIVRLFEDSVSGWNDADWPDIVREKWHRLADAQQDEIALSDLRLANLRRVAWGWVGQERDDQAPLGGPIIAHKGKAYYVRVGDEWAGPWIREDFGSGVVANLRALYGLQVPDFSALMAGFSERLRDVRLSMVAEKSYLSGGVLTVAINAPRTDLVPEFSPIVAAGIHRLAGDHADKLEHWIAGLTRQDVPCRALVLSGVRGTGKTLMLSGLARIWPGGAALMRQIVGRRFNDAALTSPFAIADDDSAPAESGEALAAFLRQAVSDREQKVEKKFSDVVRLEGCMRYAVATNDAVSLVQGAVSYKLNDESIAAFGERLLHIPVDSSARGWWGDDPGALVEGDVIARHALWLAQQRTEARERFWVEEADASLRVLATISSGLRGDILLQIDQLTQGDVTVPGSGVELKGGAVLVSARGLIEGWHHDRPRGLAVRSVGLALKSLAAASGVPQPYQGGVRKHAIGLALVRWYARHCGA